MDSIILRLLVPVRAILVFLIIDIAILGLPFVVGAPSCSYSMRYQATILSSCKEHEAIVLPPLQPCIPRYQYANQRV